MDSDKLTSKTSNSTSIIADDDSEEFDPFRSAPFKKSSNQSLSTSRSSSLTASTNSLKASSEAKTSAFQPYKRPNGIDENASNEKTNQRKSKKMSAAESSNPFLDAPFSNKKPVSQFNYLKFKNTEGKNDKKNLAIGSKENLSDNIKKLEIEETPQSPSINSTPTNKSVELATILTQSKSLNSITSTAIASNASTTSSNSSSLSSNKLNQNAASKTSPSPVTSNVSAKISSCTSSAMSMIENGSILSETEPAIPRSKTNDSIKSGSTSQAEELVLTKHYKESYKSPTHFNIQLTKTSSQLQYSQSAFVPTTKIKATFDTTDAKSNHFQLVKNKSTPLASFQTEVNPNKINCNKNVPSTPVSTRNQQKQQASNQGISNMSFDDY